ncbi:hypothetical protein F5Y15DRAFT_427821 [Xylariaceae sp. FL0016]|nr:hypothetical protein F5Y15DRAFT_427821 [Xylariaceae sp. FL0016]
MQFSTIFITLATATLSLAHPFHFGNPFRLAKRGYAPGNCGIHVTQYVKSTPGAGNIYQFTVTVKDANGTEIGKVEKQPIETFETFRLKSELPFNVTVRAGYLDYDPVDFSYGSHVWSSSYGCGLGGYGNGTRDMDCGFECD